MELMASRAIALGLLACNAATTPPSPSAPFDEVTRAPALRDATAIDWLAVDCAKLITINDIATICRSTRSLANLVADGAEGRISPGSGDPNPSTRSTCSRSLTLEEGGVFLHLQVTDHGSADALAKLIDVWRRAFPERFQDGLYSHDLRQDWTRHDVDGYKGRLSVSVFETDQPGHAPLCGPDNLAEIVRRIRRHLPDT
jgi:hypothetical protein